ncbi:MAG: heavy metal-responsive transcriptional regulator [Actinomycetia bacterium]|nr:heavy metal-responsive transcriptional regulator [Actinomycetes bacterium]
MTRFFLKAVDGRLAEKRVGAAAVAVGVDVGRGRVVVEVTNRPDYYPSRSTPAPATATTRPRRPARLAFIRDAQAAGLTLAVIRGALAIRVAGHAPCQHVSDLIDQHLALVEQRITELTQARTALHDLGLLALGVAMDDTHHPLIGWINVGPSCPQQVAHVGHRTRQAPPGDPESVRPIMANRYDSAHQLADFQSCSSRRCSAADALNSSRPPASRCPRSSHSPDRTRPSSRPAHRRRSCWRWLYEAT